MSWDILPTTRSIYEAAVMLDSGPLISLYDEGDGRGQSIQLVFEDYQEQNYPLFITSLIVAETHRRILYDVGYPQALRFLRQITDGSVTIVRPESCDTADAISIVEKYSDHRITCADAVSMAVMKRKGIIQILSYDHHFWIPGFLIPAQVFSLRTKRPGETAN